MLKLEKVGKTSSKSHQIFYLKLENSFTLLNLEALKTASFAVSLSERFLQNVPTWQLYVWSGTVFFEVKNLSFRDDISSHAFKNE